MKDHNETPVHATRTDVAGTCAQIALGIDNISVLEDIFGDQLGQEIVDAVEARIRQTIPHLCGYRRTSHDHFLICLPGKDLAAALAMVEGVQSAVASDLLDTRAGPVAVTVSAGCAARARDLGEKNDLEPLALQALHMAKRAGVGSVRTAEDDGALLRYREQLIQTSRATIGAMGDDRLTIAFQPVVRASGGNLISFHECLVRIREDEKTVIPASAFMPVIEQLGLASLIDRQVLKMSMETLIRHPTARLSINIFPQTMQDRAWMRLFENVAESDPSLPERLIVEVTETAAVLDPPRTQAFMDKLRAFGVSFALDDFGAGHTSLRYLRDFRFDIIKIDGRFVHDVHMDPDNAFIIKTLVDVARRFDMMTVAESVQTPAEARCLSGLGVEFFQGFQFGSPSLLLKPTPSPMPSIAAQA